MNSAEIFMGAPEPIARVSRDDRGIVVNGLATPCLIGLRFQSETPRLRLARRRRGNAVLLQIMPELVVAEAEPVRGAALVEAAGGERLAQQRRLVAAHARLKIARFGSRRGCDAAAPPGGCDGTAAAGRKGEAKASKTISSTGRSGNAARATARSTDVAQLADIAGPGMGGKGRLGGAREAGKDLAPELAGHGAGEMIGEQRDVLPPLAQRRDRHDVEGEAVEQVGAERAGRGKRRQIDIGRGDDPDIDRQRLVAADPLERRRIR